jgi:predicted DNA-binding transcriptional regulator YafY
MRLLAVLELLQARREMTGAEIAERLQVDPRSVRRYIKALQEMEIPIEAERGRYGAYRLDRGFKLPPMMFTEDEAAALTLGLMVIRAFAFPVDQLGVSGALAKIERVLPKALLDQTLALQESLHFDYLLPTTSIQSGVVKALLAAMQQGRRLQVQYRSWNNERTARGFDPYGIVFHEGWWYVAGYCQLRQDVRTLRLDRIKQVDVADERFTRPQGFDAVEHVRRALSQPAGVSSVEVLFLTSLPEAQRAIPSGLGTLEAVDGGVLFRRPAYRLEWVAPILLGLDFPIRIIQPPELASLMQALGEKAIRLSEAVSSSRR